MMIYCLWEWKQFLKPVVHDKCDMIYILSKYNNHPPTYIGYITVRNYNIQIDFLEKLNVMHIIQAGLKQLLSIYLSPYH